MIARTLVLTALILLVEGCASNSTQVNPPPPACVPASAQFAYLLTNGGVQVSMYAANSCTGTFTATTPATVTTGPNAFGSEDMVMDRMGRFLYVANLVSNVSGPSAISMYTIDSSSGLLTSTTPPTVATGWFPQGIAIDPAGRFVYTANTDDNTVSMFTINSATGVLTPATPPSVAANTGPVQVTVDPTGRFVYVATQDNLVSMYTINPATGVLSPMTPPTVSAGGTLFAVTVAPSGKFAYAVDNLLNRVAAFTVDPNTGVLLPTNPVEANTGNNPTDLVVDPSGKFAYVTNRQDNTVGLYTIDQTTGALTQKNTFPTGNLPFHLRFDPQGKFLYVVNEQAPTTVYTINSDGSLTNMGTAGSASLQLAMH